MHQWDRAAFGIQFSSTKRKKKRYWTMLFFILNISIKIRFFVLNMYVCALGQNQPIWFQTINEWKIFRFKCKNFVLNNIFNFFYQVKIKMVIKNVHTERSFLQKKLYLLSSINILSVIHFFEINFSNLCHTLTLQTYFRK